MNSIKAFLKAKGLYLVCLALVFAATITGIAAIRSVVRGVEDLTRIQKQALEEGTDVWDSPDAAVNQPAQDVPVATAQPSPAPSAAGSASSSLQQGAGQSGSASGGTGSSAASSAQQGTLPHAGWNGKVSQAFSGNTLVYNPTLGDWRTHNGTDYTAEQVTPVP
jgi:murein DD-endopeptidase MepM/ murein hydrolase activator NlpD